ncbi:MAG: sigma-70 family RNA polymerase sigma factor [Clostridia bacterium]|jgi:RNA polymerase sporulation-specific sigma factor|nr:sigma-70 family RNA polymerase sigma factor [Clostridia bacterium]
MQYILFKIRKFFYELFHRDNLLTAKNIVCYVCGNEEFLPPLSSDEEMRLLELKETGDVRATERLIEHNLRLVAYIARKFENTNIDYEDLISTGAIGLIKAVKTFKADKNIRLATYASRCIENEILMQIRKNSKIKNDLSLDKPLSEDFDGNQLVLADIIPSDDDLITTAVDEPGDKQLIGELISKLNSREREIMVLRYGLEGQQELTQREVAVKLGISQSYISRLEKRILFDMKLEIQKQLSN